ncbi:1,2-phenylacetyl-CoA epoxidase subunit PaaE [Pararobbsia silviterrae]|uniref:Phenylacetate-CoA oxygenase/reductase subunit PaaK n=1 Tax=Pararobbsia silviterrae TaxID=1792498 RepID=A0A494Y337_9BURK|nr:1,2-phenylacetyl-CoA epoxidase subunit PaaE [Pararobbsia silviterrae]RKP55873.1 phenylacetate-CoA oxygenase/reductase subunit PaaK [Pararobbsia silviterrae]
MNTHFYALRVRDVRPDTDDAVVVTFDLPDALAETFRFSAGQYLTLRQQVDGADLRRSYSICSGVDDRALSVAVRKVAGGAFSTWVNDALRVGDDIDVMPPQGTFHVSAPASGDDLHRGRAFLFIAAGSGITPILSIMKTVLAREPACRCTLIYGNRMQSTAMFKEEIEDLKNRYMTRVVLHHVFSREQTDTPLSSGRLDREKIARVLQTLVGVEAIDHAFICGPHQVNDEAEMALLDAGLASERIHIERFGAPPPVAGARAEPVRADVAPVARITIVRDGMHREIRFDKTDTSILDAASGAGLDMPFSCKSGVCCTCRAKLLRGEVRMDRNFALDKHELDAGFVLTCQAYPVTEEVVLSFDER